MLPKKSVGTRLCRGCGEKGDRSKLGRAWDPSPARGLLADLLFISFLILQNPLPGQKDSRIHFSAVAKSVI